MCRVAVLPPATLSVSCQCAPRPNYFQDVPSDRGKEGGARQKKPDILRTWSATLLCYVDAFLYRKLTHSCKKFFLSHSWVWMGPVLSRFSPCPGAAFEWIRPKSFASATVKQIHRQGQCQDSPKATVCGISKNTNAPTDDRYVTVTFPLHWKLDLACQRNMRFRTFILIDKVLLWSSRLFKTRFKWSISWQLNASLLKTAKISKTTHFLDVIWSGLLYQCKITNCNILILRGSNWKVKKNLWNQ